MGSRRKYKPGAQVDPSLGFSTDDMHTYRPFEHLFESQYPHTKDMMKLFLSKGFQNERAESWEKASKLFDGCEKKEQALIVQKVVSEFSDTKPQDLGDALVEMLSATKKPKPPDYLPALKFVSPHLTQKQKDELFHTTEKWFFGKEPKKYQAQVLSAVMTTIGPGLQRGDLDENSVKGFTEKLHMTLVEPLEKPDFPKPPRGSFRGKSFMDILAYDAAFDKKNEGTWVPNRELFYDDRERRGSLAIASFNALSTMGALVDDVDARVTYAKTVAKGLLTLHEQAPLISLTCWPALSRLIDSLPESEKEKMIANQPRLLEFNKKGGSTDSRTR